MAPNFKMMGLSFGLVMLSNTFLDKEDPTHALIVRVMYTVSQLACYGVLFYLYYKAKNNTEAGVVTVKEDVGFGQEGERDEKITVSEHDQRMCWKDIQRFGIGSAITVFLHYKWGFFPPLIIQSITQPFNLAQSPIVKVTLLGERAWGELRRPWVDPTSMGKQWTAWNDTIQGALTGEQVQRTSKKAAKKAARKSK